jgi:hypothetical protein
VCCINPRLASLGRKMEHDFLRHSHSSSIILCQDGTFSPPRHHGPRTDFRAADVVELPVMVVAD